MALLRVVSQTRAQDAEADDDSKSTSIDMLAFEHGAALRIQAVERGRQLRARMRRLHAGAGCSPDGAAGGSNGTGTALQPCESDEDEGVAGDNAVRIRACTSSIGALEKYQEISLASPTSSHGSSMMNITIGASPRQSARDAPQQHAKQGKQDGSDRSILQAITIQAITIQAITV